MLPNVIFIPDLIAKLQKSPCYGIICDETIDLSTTKQLIIYIIAITYDHTMVPSTDTFFLALQEINDATSDAIVSCISETLSEHGLELCNCTGLGSDGANVR